MIYLANIAFFHVIKTRIIACGLESHKVTTTGVNIVVFNAVDFHCREAAWPAHNVKTFSKFSACTEFLVF